MPCSAVSALDGFQRGFHHRQVGHQYSMLFFQAIVFALQGGVFAHWAVTLVGTDRLFVRSKVLTVMLQDLAEAVQVSDGPLLVFHPGIHIKVPASVISLLTFDRSLAWARSSDGLRVHGSTPVPWVPCLGATPQSRGQAAPDHRAP
jgi:hypothetical protein